MDTIKYITDVTYNIKERILIPTAESVYNFSYKIKNWLELLPEEI